MQSLHPQAIAAALAAECAGEQGKYWEMHDLLFEGQSAWSGDQNADATFQGYAADLGLDEAQFEACLAEQKYLSQVAADQQEGAAAGVTGTPAFRINGVALSGAQPFEAFQQQVEFFLAGGEPPTLEVAADSFRSLGDADAPVVVTEFSDYQCPACAAVEQQVIPGLIEQYVDTGKARFVYREFPLEGLHPNARKASEAAVCAGQQDGYWEMHEKLFATQGEWGAQDVSNPSNHFRGYAEELGMDTKVFSECLDSGEADGMIRTDMMAAQTFGVRATPTFFINDLPIEGGRSTEALGTLIDYVAAGGEPPEIVPTGDDWHRRGNTQTAQAITVAFVDYASPDSAQHNLDVLPKLTEEYIDSGKLIYVMHPWSEDLESAGAQAATAAECAGQQGQFLEMNDSLFGNQETWTEADDPRAEFVGYAESSGLDIDEFETCLDSDWAALRVMTGSALSALYGVPGAPVFLFNNGDGREGSPTFEEFQTIIDSILGQ